MQEPLVSCLCVTRGRPALRRAVACFQSQTHRRRELVVVHDAGDEATPHYVDSLRDDSVRAVSAPRKPQLKLGGLRNLAVDASRGDYVAQWDDDDWYAPERLAVQLQAIRETSYRACVLWRWTLFDMQTGEAYVSMSRPWEGSLVAERAVLPRYPDLARFEDTPLVEELAAAGILGGIDRPDLYVYVYHGGNTWTRVHWKRYVLREAQPLPPADSARLGALLAREVIPCS